MYSAMNTYGGESVKVKTKKKICGWISAANFTFVLGVVGGMECQNIGIEDGIYKLAAGLLMFVLAAYKGGFFRHI